MLFCGFERAQDISSHLNQALRVYHYRKSLQEAEIKSWCSKHSPLELILICHHLGFVLESF